MRYFLLGFIITLLIPQLYAQGDADGDKAVSILDRFQADKLFRSGLELYNSNKMAQALDKFNDVIQLNPQHPEVFELLGEIYYLNGNYEEAYDKFSVASKQHPENPKLHNDLGVAAAGSGAYLVAMDHFKDALKLDPERQDARDNLEEAEKRQRILAGNLNEDDDPVTSNSPDESKFQDTDRPGGFEPGSQAGPGGDNSSTLKRRRSGKNYSYAGTQLQVQRQSDPYVDVLSVRITSNRTIVTFRVTNPNRKTFKFKLAPPRSDDAWFLVDSKGYKSYPLVTFLNQPEVARDKPISVSYGEEYITAYFALLDPDVYEFNILEGKKPVPGAWNFYKVTLLDKEDQ